MLYLNTMHGLKATGLQLKTQHLWQQDKSIPRRCTSLPGMPTLPARITILSMGLNNIQTPIPLGCFPKDLVTGQLCPSLRAILNLRNWFSTPIADNYCNQKFFSSSRTRAIQTSEFIPTIPIGKRKKHQPGLHLLQISENICSPVKAVWFWW